MDCPACNAKLMEVKAGDIVIDLCQNGCGGAWFDQKEISHFDEQHELNPAVIFKITRATGLKRNASPLNCPRCRTEVLARQSFDIANKVEIDLCWNCGGLWLDPGELSEVRQQFKTEAERIKAGDAFLKVALDQHTDAMKINTKKFIEKHNRMYSNHLTALISSFRSLIVFDE